MTDSDRTALRRLAGGGDSGRATTDDLQGLLLQVVFALLMVFMIFFCKLASTNTGVWFFGLTTSCAVWQAVASIWNLVPAGMAS